MKIDAIFAFISAGIAALVAFGIFMVNAGETYRILITVGSLLSLFVTLGGTLALSSPNGGTANIRVVSGLFFALLLVVHIVFSFVGVRLTPYVMITGILSLVYVLVCYSVVRALK